MAIRKITVCLGLAYLVLVNFGVMARAFFPYDPKIHDVIDRGEKFVSIERVQQIADHVSNSYRFNVFPILILDVFIVALSYFALTKASTNNTTAEMPDKQKDTQ